MFKVLTNKYPSQLEAQLNKFPDWVVVSMVVLDETIVVIIRRPDAKSD